MIVFVIIILVWIRVWLWDISVWYVTCMIGIVFPWQWSLGPKGRTVLGYAWLYAYTLLLYASSRGWNRPQLPVERYRRWLPVERYRWYCMVCGMIEELTKLCAYDFGFGFRYLFVKGERAGGIASHHTHDFRTGFSGIVLWFSCFRWYRFETWPYVL